MLLNLNNSVTDWLFPRRCLACSADIATGHLCVSCRSFCHRTKFNVANEHHAVFYFEMTIKEIIKNAKFNKSSNHLYLLYQLLMEELDLEIIDKIKCFAPEIITYIPNHWVHRMIRGVELPLFFAEIISKKINVPVIPMLEKSSFLNRQVLQKSRQERQSQIEGAFRLKEKRRFSRILLVDDIVTTGATFNESKKILGRSREIYCLAIAKTP